MDEYRKYEPIFGSWYLSRLIGKGSFGKVYEIVREEYGMEYKAALKIISVPQDENDIKTRMTEGSSRENVSTYYKSILKEITRENLIMSKLKGNSNIVSYEDHQIIPHDDGLGYDILIRMELLTPLLDRMMQKKLDEKEVVKLGVDMCKALELCHRKKIIHRDIKPQNIFISDAGDFKLGDFGIARTMEKTTGGMSAKGTYKYMAPEVFRGEDYGATVDMYSLGIVLFSLLNGNRGPFLPAPPTPITFNDEEEARRRRFRGEPIPEPRNCGTMLSEIIKKACAADSSERYQTAGQMRADLEQYLMLLSGEATVSLFSYNKSAKPETVSDRDPENYRERIISDETEYIEDKEADATEYTEEKPSVQIAHSESVDPEKTEYEKTEQLINLQKADRVDDEEADAAEQIITRKKEIEEIKERQDRESIESERRVEERQIDSAIAAKKRRKILMLTLLLLVCCAVFAILLTKRIVLNHKYDKEHDKAMQLIESGDYEEAYLLLQEIGDTETCSQIRLQYEKSLLSKAEVGSTVVFGYYEQNNDTSDGPEDIEWIVLEKNGSNLLVISKYALDCQLYNSRKAVITWETCSLRKWLNGTFINNAFSSDEQAMIASTIVTADKNPSSSTSPGNNTTDKVFLLSIAEVNKYFGSDGERTCQGTEYCYAKGAWNASYGNCIWWLRSPGYNSNYAAYVLANGSVNYEGFFVSDDDIAVRPVLWINLDF